MVLRDVLFAARQLPIVEDRMECISAAGSWLSDVEYNRINEGLIHYRSISQSVQGIRTGVTAPSIFFCNRRAVNVRPSVTNRSIWVDRIEWI